MNANMGLKLTDNIDWSWWLGIAISILIWICVVLTILVKGMRK